MVVVPGIAAVVRASLTLLQQDPCSVTSNWATAIPQYMYIVFTHVYGWTYPALQQSVNVMIACTTALMLASLVVVLTLCNHQLIPLIITAEVQHHSFCHVGWSFAMMRQECLFKP